MSRLALVLRVLGAWSVGAAVVGFWWLGLGFALPPPATVLDSPLTAAVAAVSFMASLATARVTVAERAGMLEVGTVLCFACVPLFLAQVLAPGIEDAAAWHAQFVHQLAAARMGAQQDLVSTVLPLEAASLACLVSGAVGLSRVTWARMGLCLVALLAGVRVGHAALPVEGAVLGSLVGVAFVVVASTARPRSADATRALSARVIALLAVAMAVGMAVDIPSHLHHVTGFGPYPYGLLWDLTEGVVHAHRVMLVRLAGCGVLLGFFVLRGRRASRTGRASRTSSASADRVALVGLVCLVGSAVTLRQARVDLLDWQWDHAYAHQPPHFPCACQGMDRSRLVPVGERLAPVDLPWPMSAQIDPGYRLGIIHTHVALDGAELEPGARRLEVDDDRTFGPFIRELSEVRDPAPTFVLEDRASVP
ncbi:MAG: hypothetical protein AB8I08_14705 [Sandaracinaceae bacterium]